MEICYIHKLADHFSAFFLQIKQNFIKIIIFWMDWVIYQFISEWGLVAQKMFGVGFFHHLIIMTVINL